MYIKIKNENRSDGNFVFDGKFRLTEEQVDRLKILETSNLFQSAVTDFRKKFSMDISTGFPEHPGRWNPFKYFEQTDKELHKLSDRLNLPYPLVSSHVFIYIRYNKWGFDPSFPEKFLEPSLGTPTNYSIEPSVFRIDENGKAIDPPKTVSLVTYARLSTKELNEAIMMLKRRQKQIFNPILTKQVRRKKDVDRDLSIEKEMDTRQPRRIKEEYTGYLGRLQPDREKGRITEKRLRELKRMHPSDVKKVKTGKTSKEVAQEALGSSKRASAARQMNSRLKKHRESLLG
jgi:hypothetical protein